MSKALAFLAAVGLVTVLAATALSAGGARDELTDVRRPEPVGRDHEAEES
jgi:hypothetical protein